MDTEPEERVIIADTEFIGWASDDEEDRAYARSTDPTAVDALIGGFGRDLTVRPPGPAPTSSPSDIRWGDIADSACELLKVRMKQDGDSLLYRGDTDGFGETAFNTRFCDALRTVIEAHQGEFVVRAGTTSVKANIAMSCRYQVVPEYRLIMTKDQSELRADIVIIDTDDPSVENADGVIGRPVAIIELKYIRYGFLRYARDAKVNVTKDLQFNTKTGRDAIRDRNHYIDGLFAKLRISQNRYEQLRTKDWTVFQYLTGNAQYIPISDILQNAAKQVEIYKTRLRDVRIQALVVMGVGKEVFRWQPSSTK